MKSREWKEIFNALASTDSIELGGNFLPQNNVDTEVDIAASDGTQWVSGPIR